MQWVFEHIIWKYTKIGIKNVIMQTSVFMATTRYDITTSNSRGVCQFSNPVTPRDFFLLSLRGHEPNERPPVVANGITMTTDKWKSWKPFLAGECWLQQQSHIPSFATLPPLVRYYDAPSNVTCMQTALLGVLLFSNTQSEWYKHNLKVILDKAARRDRALISYSGALISGKHK